VSFQKYGTVIFEIHGAHYWNQLFKWSKCENVRRFDGYERRVCERLWKILMLNWTEWWFRYNSKSICPFHIFGYGSKFMKLIPLLLDIICTLNCNVNATCPG